MNRSYAASALLIATSLVTHAQTLGVSSGATQSDAIESYLQPLVHNHTIAGAVTLVATRTGVVYLKAVGERDIAAKAPMTTDDMFWIA